MGMGLDSGFAAGGGADELQLILQRLAEQAARSRQLDLQSQRQQQEETDRAAQRDLQLKMFSAQEADRQQAAKDRANAAAATAENQAEQRFQGKVKLQPAGSLLAPTDVPEYQKRAPSLIEDAATNPTDVVPGTDNPLRPTGKMRFIGTDESRLKAAAEADKNRQDPVFVIDDKGVMRQVGSAPKGSHISNEPRPTAVPSPQPQVFYDGAGKPHAIQFVGGQAREIPLPDTLNGKAQPKPDTTPAGIQQQQVTAANVRKHLDDVGKEATILDQMGLMGPVGSRWADFMAGRVGAGELAAGDPQKAQLLGEFRADVKLLQSGMAMVHGGARSGSSPGMASRMESIINSDKMDLPLFQGALSSFDKWLAGYEKPGAAANATPSTTPGAPKIGEQRTINGQLGEWDGIGWKPVAAVGGMPVIKPVR